MIKKINFAEDFLNFREIKDFFKDYNKLLQKFKFDDLTNDYRSTLNREINKALVRTIVRYDSNFNGRFIDKIKEKIIFKFGDNAKKYYITDYPYLLIHLPKDKYEEGRFHTDVAFNTGHSITCWIPINHYEIEYSPITIYLNSQNKFNLYALKFLGKISQKLFEFYANISFKKILINAKPNKIFFWKDSTIHKGNFNYKELIHSAVTFKITEKKNQVENSSIIAEKKIYNLYQHFDINEILNQLNKIKIFVDNNMENKINQREFIDYIILNLDIKNNKKEFNKLLAFASGIIAQRLAFSSFKKATLLFCLISLSYVKNSDDIIYLKNSFCYLYLKKKIHNLNELI